MESDFLEISGDDDDSLLLHHQQQPQHDAVSSFFSCSPLHFPRSNPPDEKSKNPSLLSNADKENINDNNNENKSELPKLSLEPQQMKRKKKGGGYNLRKSLAWNRAFFTEEGVLNSTELSLISGDFGTLRGETLSAIEEENGEESLSVDSPHLQTLENNLFKELPLNNSTKKEEKKNGSCSLQKSSSSVPRSGVKQNVLSAHHVNRTGSKRSGCPRPVMTSALKRPANVSTTKAAIKEPKVTKIPATKTNSSVLSTTAKIGPNINKSKRDQSAQSAVNAHRSTGLTGAGRSSRSTQNDAKSSLSNKSQIPKSSVRLAKRNVGSSALASSQHPLVTKADNGLKVNQDAAGAAGHGSINHEASSSKTASLPQSGCNVSGNTQYAQPQMAKPSGLRMPSPSLGFFAQSKTNASRNLQSSTQLCNNPKSKIPSLQNLGVLNSICESPTFSIKGDAAANDIAATTNARMSITEDSVPSTANSLCGNIGPNSRASKMPRVEVKVPCNSNNHELTNSKQLLRDNENDLQKQIEDVGLLCSGNELHLQSLSSKQEELDCKGSADLVIARSSDHNGEEFKDPNFNSHHSFQTEGAFKADDFGHQLSVNEQHNSLMEDGSLLSQLHSGDVSCNNLHGSPKLNNDQISFHDGHEQSSKQAEQANDQIINKMERPHINEGTLLEEGEPPEEFLSYNGVQSKGICPEVRDCSASELEKTKGGPDVLNLQSHVADENMHALDGNLYLESSSSLLNASEADNQHILGNYVNGKLAEQPPLPNSDIVVERVFQDNYRSPSTDCLLDGEIISSEVLLTESNLQSVEVVASEIADGCQREMENFGATCLIQPSLQNAVHEIAKVVEYLPVDNEVSVSTDTQCNCDIEFLCETTTPKRLEKSREDQVTGAITACDIGLSNDCRSGGDLSGIEMDNFPSVSDLSQVVQLKGYSEVVGTIDIKSVEGNQHDLSAKCNSTLSEPAENITSFSVDASAMLTKSSVDEQIDSEIAEAMTVNTQCNPDIEFFCETTMPKRLGKSREDQVTGAITACDIGLSNDCLSGGDLSGIEMKNFPSVSDLSQVVQLKGYSDVVDMIDIKSFEGNQHDLSAKCNSTLSEPAEKITSLYVDASAMLTKSSVDEQIDSEIAEAELIRSFEAGNAFLENQISDTIHGLLSVEGKSFEESQISDGENGADIGPRNISSPRGALEGPSDLSQIEHTNEPNEKFTARVNEETMGSFGEDTCVQSFGDGVSFDSCKPNISTSEENNNFTVVEDLNGPPELQNVVIVERGMSDKFGLSVCEEVSSKVKITLLDNDHGSGNSCKLQAFSSLNDESTSSIKTNHTSSSGNVLQEEVNSLENDVRQEFNSPMIPVEAKGSTPSLEKTDIKQDAPVERPPLNAVPFSDEWLAALETAGEEILTRKGGAVQNSPKDKSEPEPGPWSPVRRKHNQEIGPYDCTKFTNTNIPHASD